jgi:hypothetical protein
MYQYQILPSGPHFIIGLSSMANFRSKRIVSLIQISRRDKTYTGKVLLLITIAKSEIGTYINLAVFLIFDTYVDQKNFIY